MPSTPPLTLREVPEHREIEAAVGAALRVSYAPPHVYPMSAPDFLSSPGAVRVGSGRHPLKLYVHVPFCNYACTFCFYAKRIAAKRSDMERYVRGLELEIAWVETGTPLAQLYVGGGTPTALPADLLDRVLALVLDRMPREGTVSHTVECSPESVTAAHAAVMRARGVDRVSLGIESMSPEVLATVHRRHSPVQALAACDLLLGAGFFVNVDLMYGLPHQTPESFRRDFEAVAARGVPSISVYNLRLNEHAPLATAMDDLERIDLRALIGWRALIRELAADLGYAQTRWHTFVRGRGAVGFERAPSADGSGPGHQLGIGMSALSHLGTTIYRNYERFDDYLDALDHRESPVAETFPLADEDRRTLLIARQIGDGKALDRATYCEAFGHDISEDYAEVLGRLERAELIRIDADSVALTEPGKLVYDLVTLAFYPARSLSWLHDRQSAGAA